MNKQETRQWRGSVCAGILTSRWPFGRMIASSTSIELKSLLGNFVLPRDEVQSVERGKFFPWLWFGIRIQHAHDGYPDRLVFSPLVFWRRRTILNRLKSLGYKVG